MKKFRKLKFRKIRTSILKYLDKEKWPWNAGFSDLLDQIDSSLFNMRANK